MAAFGEKLLGLWGTSLDADEKAELPAFRLIYEFKDGGNLVVHSEGSPPTPGAYELELGEDTHSFSLVVPVAMAPLIMGGIVRLRDADTLLVRFCNPATDAHVFLDHNHSTVEQLVLRRTDNVNLSPNPRPALSPEVQAMSDQARKIGCIREYLATSMNAGVQAMQQENGLGGALKQLAQSGGEGLHPLAASTYFHSALQMGSKHAHIFYRFGFLPDEVATLMNEPEAQQVAQECMIQQMAQLMGGQEGLEALFGGAAAEGLPNIEGLSLGGPGADMGPLAGMSGMSGMAGLNDSALGLGSGMGGFGGLDAFGSAGMDAFGGIGGRVEGMDDGDQPSGEQPPNCGQQ